MYSLNQRLMQTNLELFWFSEDQDLVKVLNVRILLNILDLNIFPLEMF